ncbi:MAG: pentapeptide repeat-containing protein, partial [Solirubrobacteraceae bacterium]
AGLAAVPRSSRAPRAMASPQPPRLEEERTEPALAPGDVDLSETRLVDVDLSGARLGGMRLVDVVVDRGNLANLAAPEPSLWRVAISGARLTGAQWTRGMITDVVFRDCRIDLATFAGTTFERTTFDGCLLAQADFREALLRSVRFDGCDLTEADVTGLRIDRCELRGCTLNGVTGLERLRGAAMPWADVVGHAGLFAAALGIRTLDEDER